MLVGCLLVANVIALPFVVLSMVLDLESTETVLDLTPASVEAADTYTYVRIDITSIDDVAGTATLHVSGNHICGGCTRKERVTFYSVANTEGGRQGDGIPPSVAIVLPAAAETLSQTIQLPIHGDLTRYPFDRQRLWLGVAFERLNQDGSIEVLSPSQARNHLFLQLRNGASRADLAPPRSLAPESVQPGRARVPYAEVFALELTRPVYLRVMVPLVVALIAAAAFYAVVLRPFNELIMNSGGLVLGVWGVRSLLLGSYPPNTTLVDGILTLLILLVLLTISVRALRHLHDQAGLTVLPGSKKD